MREDYVREPPGAVSGWRIREGCNWRQVKAATVCIKYWSRRDQRAGLSGLTRACALGGLSGVACAQGCAWRG